MHIDADRLRLSPSDVTAFLACEHLTTLSLAHARGELERPEVENEQAELIFRKGLEHERAYLEHLRAEGKTVLEIPDPRRRLRRAPPARPPTRCAPARPTSSTRASSRTRAGAASPTSSSAGRTAPTRRSTPSSRARRSPPTSSSSASTTSSSRGSRGASRSRSTSCSAPASRQSFRPEEFAAYYRRVRSRLEQFVADPPPTEPYPVDHCGICEFKPALRRALGRVDHLCRVAGLHRTQIEKLAAAGITTLAALGRAPAEPVPAGINPDSWAKLREQAELQLHARETGRGQLPAAPAAARAPASRSSPTPRPATSSSTSRATRSGTRAARSSTSGGSSTSTATSRRSTRTTTTPSGRRSSGSSTSSTSGSREHPDLHVYHYAAYEITALKRLMGRYGTREAELDDLLRRGVFVDLSRSSATACAPRGPATG